MSGSSPTRAAMYTIKDADNMKSKKSIVNSIMLRLKKLVSSKEILELVINSTVYLALDKKIVNEVELRQMVNNAIALHNKTQNRYAFIDLMVKQYE